MEDVPPVAIHMLMASSGPQQEPSRVRFQPFASGTHCIHGTMAPRPMAMLVDKMTNQTKAFMVPDVSLRRVTAKAVLVHTMAVMVTVARLLRASVSSMGSSTARTELCRPSFRCSTR